MMKKRTLLIGFGGNLLISLFGILQAFHGFNVVLGVSLYFGKHDKFPDGIEPWVMQALLECRDTLIRLFMVFLALLLFNFVFGFWIWRSKMKDDHAT